MRWIWDGIKSLYPVICTWSTYELINHIPTKLVMLYNPLATSTSLVDAHGTVS